MRLQLILLFLLFPLTTIGQIDSTKVKKLLDEAYGYEDTDPNKALEIYRNAYLLSNKSDYYLGAFRSLQYSGIVHANLVNYDSAIYYYKKALPYSEKAQYPKGKAATYINIGNVYQFNGDYDKVVDYYLEGIKVFEIINDSTSIATSYENLASLFSSINQHDKEIIYLEKALLITPKSNLVLLSHIYGDMGLAQTKIKNLPKALEYFTKADSLSKLVNIPRLDFFVSRNFGEYHFLVGSYKIAIPFFNKALEANEKINDPYYKSHLLIKLGQAYAMLKDNEKARSYLKEALEMGKENNVKEIQMKAYLGFSKIDKEQNNFQKAYENLSLHITFKDSLLNEQYSKQINLLEKQYETKNKDNEIAQQKLQIQEQENDILKKKNEFYLATGSGGLLLLGSLGLWLFYRQRQKLKNIEIEKLHQVNEITKLEAMIEGEEKERNRLAQDLHDGINGDLSAIKHQLSSITSEKLDDDDQKTFHKAIDMIDNSCQQVRRISHNLSPLTIKDFGLVASIEQYCSKLKSLHPIAINFQHFGEEISLPESIETNIYRIIQELLNNIVKHSKATGALVQLNNHKENLFITVEDNGEGFNKEDENNGIGLKNIVSRVELLNGQLDIDHHEQGTTFTINIDLLKIPHNL